MKSKWNEMTTNQKILYVGTIFFCLAGTIFAMLDLLNAWTYAKLGWTITFAVYLAMEAKSNWNKNRKIAVIDLVLVAALVVTNILTMVF